MSEQPFVHPGPAKHSDTIKSFVGTVQALTRVERERDAANVQLDKIRQLCTEAEDIGGQNSILVDEIRAVLEEQL